LVSNRSTDW